MVDQRHQFYVTQVLSVFVMLIHDSTWGDIVVGDIDKPRCRKCKKQKQKSLWKRKNKVRCDIVIGEYRQP